MIRILVSLVALFFVSSAWSNVVVKVKNTTSLQRHEVVEIDAQSLCKRLGIASVEKNIIVKNALNEEVAYQVTYNGKVLIDASVQPLKTAKFKIAKGTPSAPVDTVVTGALYKQRVDDIAWENDRCAYRIYGPALQATGERAFGVDVWTKNIPSLVVAERYRLNNYHKDNGNGLDCYNVGPSLGCGAPALMDADSLVLPYCYKDFKFLDNGPLRFTVELVYNAFSYKGDKKVVEHRIISLDKNTHFNKMTVWYEGLSKAAPLAAGVVVHQSDTTGVILGKNYVHYADPTDKASKHNCQIYVATLFPFSNTAMKLLWHKETKDVAGHAVGVTTYRPGDRFNYYFGSAWSKYDIHSQSAWQLRIEESIKAIQHPLEVVIE